MMDSPSSSPLVRPLVVSPSTSERLLLEDALSTVLERAETGAICVFGPRGSGKTTALQSLARKLSCSARLDLLDDPQASQVAERAGQKVVIYTAGAPWELPHLATFRLAPWGEDEALEYLLAAHKDRCGSVIQRLRATGIATPLELPRLWTLCLDQMAEDDSLLTIDAAMRRYLDQRVPPAARARAREVCFRKVVTPEEARPNPDELWGDPGYMEYLRNGSLPGELTWLIRELQFRVLLAAEYVVNPETGEYSTEGLLSKLPQSLVEQAGRFLQNHPASAAALEASLGHHVTLQPMGASLLHAARVGWRPPDRGTVSWFPGARLRGVSWPGLNLPQAQFVEADLSGAVLRESTLDGATLANARLARANLSDASLVRIWASGADLSGADLRRAVAFQATFLNASLVGADLEAADLHEARFHGANLSLARFCRADLKGADFAVIFAGGSWEHPFEAQEKILDLARRYELSTEGMPTRETRYSETDFTGADLQKASLGLADLRTAILSGALLMGADLRGCTLEGNEIPGGRFERARLNFATLTGSVMPGASFHGAILFGARMADVQWERVDLREADLRRVTFHLGSSRSGLVFGDPSEGTRNGFYTDDFNDQSYRSPEDIRVANLRGADLRGARIGDTDFYLVDLREAKYTPEQEAHFRRCGAILEARV
jgi:uncharacterized protein YjbI with pentapeptide repeats